MENPKWGSGFLKAIRQRLEQPPGLRQLEQDLCRRIVNVMVCIGDVDHKERAAVRPNASQNPDLDPPRGEMPERSIIDAELYYVTMWILLAHRDASIGLWWS